MRQAFFDVKVVSPLARSYCNRPILDVMKSAEKEKCREYRERIVGVEHADFNPLVFTVSCAIGPQSAMGSEKDCRKAVREADFPRSVVAGWLRCRLSFALLRTTLLCVRGTRKNRTNTIENNVPLATSVGKIDY